MEEAAAETGPGLGKEQEEGMDLELGADAATTSDAQVRLCDVCCEARRQYKCPRCGVGTCCLECCKRHKAEQNCSGRRDRTGYVSMQTFSNAHLRNDYHFLEDVLQTKDSAKRTLVSSCGGLPAAEGKRQGGNKRNAKRARTEGGALSQQQPQPGHGHGGDVLLPGQRPLQHLGAHTQGVRNLVAGAASSGRNTQVIVLAPGMSKRSANTSQYRSKADEMLWRVHAVFVIRPAAAAGARGDADADADADAPPLLFAPSALLRPELEPTCAESGLATLSLLAEDPSGQSLLAGMALQLVHERESVASVLARCLDPLPGNSAQRHALRSMRHDRQDLLCLMQSIPSPGAQPLFFEVPLGWTLREALQGRAVVEYPTLVFAFPEHVSHLRRLVCGEAAGVGAERGEQEGAGGGESPSKVRRVADRSGGGGGGGGGAAEGQELDEGGEEEEVVVEEGEEEGEEEDEEGSFFQAFAELQNKGIAELRQIAEGGGL